MPISNLWIWLIWRCSGQACAILPLPLHFAQLPFLAVSLLASVRVALPWACGGTPLPMPASGQLDRFLLLAMVAPLFAPQFGNYSNQMAEMAHFRAMSSHLFYRRNAPNWHSTRHCYSWRRTFAFLSCVQSTSSTWQPTVDAGSDWRSAADLASVYASQLMLHLCLLAARIATAPRLCATLSAVLATLCIARS